MPHEIFLTARQTTKKRNVYVINMSIDIKLSKAHISKIIPSGGSFRSWLVNLVKKALTNVAISLARNDLSGLVISLTSNAINKLHRKISGNEYE